MNLPLRSWGGSALALRDLTLRACSTFALDRLCVALAAVAAVIAVYATQMPQNLQIISQVNASKPGPLQLYYSDDGVFSELRTQLWPIGAGQPQRVVFSVPTDHSSALRLDPAAGVERIELCEVKARLPDGAEQSIGRDLFSATSSTSVSTAGGCVIVTSSGSELDPQVRLNLSSIQPRLQEIRKRRTLVAVSLILACAASLLLARAISRRTGRRAVQVTAISDLTARVPTIYLTFALVTGGLLCVITPPGAVPDEPAHIAKTILVENGEWVGRAEPNFINPGLAEVLGPFDDFLNPGKRFKVSDVLEHAGRQLECRSSSDPYPEAAAAYSPTMYMPGAYVLNAACHFEAPTGAFVYGGRFANLLLSVLLVFFGLRAAGGHAWPIFVVALLPMTLYEQASFAADSPVLGLTLCVVGTQVGLATRQVRPGVGIEVALLTLGLALALSKPGYAWVCVGFLFCFWAYRDARRSFWPRVVLLIAAPWIVHIAWTLASAGGATPRIGVDPRLQMELILSEPVLTLRLWLRTFFGEGSSFLWSSLVGRLGWLDVVLHPGTYALALASMIVSLGMRGDATPPVPHLWTRVLAAFFAGGAVMLPALPMYLFWTPPGAWAIEGLQGRYLIPSLAFCLAWLSFRMPLWWRSTGGLFMLCAAIVINLDALLRVVLRYYT